MRLLLPCLGVLPIVAGVVQAAIPANVEQAFEMYCSVPNELVPILEKVTDKESADAAAPALLKVLPKLYDVRTALSSIDKMSPEVEAEVRKKYAAQMQRNWGKLYEQIFRLQQVDCYKSPAFFKQFYVLCMMLNK